MEKAGDIEAVDTAEVDDLEAGAEVDTGGQQERDYEAEARHHGWTPKEDFRGDPARWVDAETFIKRADEVMPFLKKQNAALKREIDDMKREFKRASKHFSETEERAYQRALTELERRHDEAVEAGDVAESKRIRKEMAELKPQTNDEQSDQPDPAQLRKELNEWIAENEWYVLDDDKRKYADLQAQLMGPAGEWEGGNKAYLAELGRRVEKKFSTTEKKPSPTNGGGNRESKGKSGRTLNDLPAIARAQAVKWDKQGIVKIEDYLKTYEWD